jgi:hypothetical protein
MGSTGSGGTETVNNQVQLPSWAAPYAAGFLGSVGNLVKQGLASGYPFSLEQVAPFNSTQQQGFNLTSQLGQSEQQPINAALGQASNILSGANLNPSSNPELQAYYNAAAQPMETAYRDATLPGIQAEFAQAGSFGGSAQTQAESLAQQNLAQGLSSLAANIYEPAYQQGQTQLTQEQALLPSLLQGAYTPAQELLGTGGTQQQLTQQQMNTALQNEENRYNFPFQLLGQLGAAIPTAVGGAYNSSQTGPNPNAISPLQGGLLGLLGAGGVLGALGGGNGLSGGLNSLLTLFG